MNNEFSFEITNESKNAINEILKQQGLRHFKLYTDFYGELDVINYEEYQKLEKEKDKEIERLNKECDSYMKIATKRGNIIDELEKWLSSEYMSGNYEEYYRMGLKDSYNKLKELKEGKSDE